PGTAERHRTFHVTGSGKPSATPPPPGPRNDGQLEVVVPAALSSHGPVSNARRLSGFGISGYSTPPGIAKRGSYGLRQAGARPMLSFKFRCPKYSPSNNCKVSAKRSAATSSK